MTTLGSIQAPKHLTPSDDAREEAVLNTAAGMAHLAGGGPKGKTCRDCARYGDVPFQKYEARYDAKRNLKPEPCGRFIGMMGRALQGTAPKVPPRSAACRFFVQQEDEKIPALRDDRK